MKAYQILILTSVVAWSQMGYAANTAYRCQVDSLNSAEALGRNQYVKACHQDVIWEHASLLNGFRKPSSFDEAWALVHRSMEMIGTRPHPRPQYYTPIFLNAPVAEQSIGWVAPKSGPAAEILASEERTKEYCDKPENKPPQNHALGPIGFKFGFRCFASCYAPEVRVFFDGEYLAMDKAFQQRPEKISVLTESSTFENMSYRLEDIEKWTVSIRSEPHVLRTIETASGQKLRVTPNHPLIVSDGFVREAADIHAGDFLVKANGEPEMVTAASDEDYFGKVYNVQPKGTTAKGNIIVAEGFLSGSNYMQNEGYELINERIFRSELPMDLIK